MGVRMIHVDNLENDLTSGLFCKSARKKAPGYVSIGSADVISRRDTKPVKCHPGDMVNDYVPFYFSVRTPMLYNIATGHGVQSYPQKDIIYLCCRFNKLATSKFKWCYTDGNAAVAITKFFSSFEKIGKNIDWHSIESTDFRDNNTDGDEDRLRKKHAEFLVKENVPAKYIERIVVYNQATKNKVEKIIKKMGANIDIIVNPKTKAFYF